MISAESNSFDKYLKDHLPREAFAKLCLRTIIWLLMLLLAGTQPQFSFYDHIGRTADTIDVPIRVLTPLILILFAIALMFKDLEHAFPEEWSQETKKGSWGAFIRSISAEFLLWMASIFLSIAVTMALTLIVVPHQDMTIDLFAKIVVILAYLTFFIFFFVSAYLLVKRVSPPLADSKKFIGVFDTPGKMASFYCANILFVLTVYIMTNI